MLPADELAEIKAKQRLLSDRAQELRALALADADARVGKTYALDIKQQLSNRTDWKELAIHLGATPEQIEAFSYPSVSEVVRIKSAFDYTPPSTPAHTSISRLLDHSDNRAFCIFDTETTGLYPKNGDRIVQIAVQVIRISPTGTIDEIESFSTYLNPEGRKSHPDAQAIHNINPKDLRNAPLFSDVKNTLMSLMQDTVLVAHGCYFDVAFLQQELHRCGDAPLTNELVDTLAIAKEIWPETRSNLDALVKKFEIKLEGRLHSAAVDARTLVQLLPFYLARIHEIRSDMPARET